jgi:hypothetical protein
MPLKGGLPMSKRVLATAFLGVLLPAWAAAPAGEITELFDALVKSPTKENYLAVHKAVAEDKSYSPYSMDLNETADLIKEKKFKEAREKLDRAMPNLLLSPRAHSLAAIAAEGLGDAARAKTEGAAAAKCIEGMLATGDGSADKPYLVSRVSDEYDLLRQLKKKHRAQGLRQKAGKSFDVMQCEDGTEVWFDVTVIFNSLAKQFEKE